MTRMGEDVFMEHSLEDSLRDIAIQLALKKVGPHPHLNHHALRKHHNSFGSLKILWMRRSVSSCSSYCVLTYFYMGTLHTFSPLHSKCLLPNFIPCRIKVNLDLHQKS